MTLKEQLPKTFELFNTSKDVEVSSFEESIHEFSTFIGKMQDSLKNPSEESLNDYQETIAQLQDLIDEHLSSHCSELGIPMKDLMSYLTNEKNYQSKQEFESVQNIKKMFEQETGASVDEMLKEQDKKRTKKSKTWIRS